MAADASSSAEPRSNEFGLWLVSSALAAVALSAYVATLCPGTPGGDAGEMLQLAIELGVPHPPGYPTWTLLAHAFYRLPLRGTTPAWRVNLSSAVFDALASGVLCAAVGLWSRDMWAGLAAGGAFAFAPLVWQYAVQCEVFALNNLLCACMLLALVCYDARRTLGRACAGALAVGLALTNQHTALFFAAPFALWTLCVSALPPAPPAKGSAEPTPPRHGSLLRPAPLLLLGACGLLGLSPYLYLVVRGGDSAAWGSWGAQRTVGGFLTHLLRREYGTFRLANTAETTDAEFWLRLYSYLASIPQQLPPHGAPLAALGLARSLSSRSLRRAGSPVLAGYVTYVLVFHQLANLPASSPFFLAIQQRFWPQANLLVSAYFGIGAAHAARRLRPRAPAASAACLSLGLVAWHAAGGGAGQPASLLALLGMPGAGGGAEKTGGGFRPADCVGTDLFDQFGLEVLRALPDEEDVILLTNGDEVLNSVRYAHRVLRVKPRLLIVDQNYAQFTWFVRRARTQHSGLGRVAFPGEAYGSSNGSFLMSEFLDANHARFRFFFCGGMHPQDRTWERGYRLWPMGAVSQILRRDASVDIQAWASRSKQLLPRLAFSRAPEAGSWGEVIARNHYLTAYALRPYALLQQAYESPGAPGERERFALAARMYDETAAEALNGSVALPDYFYRNWGVAYSQLIRLEPTVKGRAGATQRAAAAFLKYLAFDTLSAEDRRAVEQGVVSLIPHPLAAAFQPSAEQAAAAAAQYQQQRQRAQPEVSAQEQQRGATPVGEARKKRKKGGGQRGPQWGIG